MTRIDPPRIVTCFRHRVVMPKAIELAKIRWKAESLRTLGTFRNRNPNPVTSPRPEIASTTHLAEEILTDTIDATVKSGKAMPLSNTESG